jgi:hypothetical protein
MGDVIRPWAFLVPSYLRWKRENHRGQLEQRERYLERKKELRAIDAELRAARAADRALRAPLAAPQQSEDLAT